MSQSSSQPELELPFDFGELVYRKYQNGQQERGVVSGFRYHPGCVSVRVEWANRSTQEFHYPFELSTEPNERKDQSDAS